MLSGLRHRNGECTDPPHETWPAALSYAGDDKLLASTPDVKVFGYISRPDVPCPECYFFSLRVQITCPMFQFSTPLQIDVLNDVCGS